MSPVPNRSVNRRLSPTGLLAPGSWLPEPGARRTGQPGRSGFGLQGGPRRSHTPFRKPGSRPLEPGAGGQEPGARYAKPASACLHRGFTLIEVLIALGILGTALAFLMNSMNQAVRQARDQKMEATAPSVAASLMNRLLFEVPYDEVKTSPPASIPGMANTTEVAGIQFRWTLQVQDVPDLTFTFDEVAYHSPHAGGAEGADPSFTTRTRPIGELDAKYSGVSVLKTLKLRVEWAWAGETDFLQRRSITLLTRRARL